MEIKERERELFRQINAVRNESVINVSEEEAPFMLREGEHVNVCINKRRSCLLVKVDVLNHRRDG